MKAFSRVLSGSIAGWLGIAISVLVQVVSVPLLLTVWTPAQYGVWILATGLFQVLTMVDFGHQNYIGYEIILAKEKEAVSRLLFSALPIAWMIGICQILFVVVLTQFGFSNAFLPNVPHPLANDFKTVLLLLSVTWLVVSSGGGILGRSIVPYGHFARLTWWRTATAFAIGVAPLGVILTHGGILQAAEFVCGANLLVNIAVHIDIIRVLMATGVGFSRPDLRFGGHNFLKSLAVAFREVLMQLRQQGIRLLLAPIAGVVALANFTTTRTLSNIMLQGINTIANPIEPELLKFIREREQSKVNYTIAFWYFVMLAISPFIVVSQAIMPFVYTIWTKGKMAFDPLLYATCVASVLFFCLSQPFISIVRGHNLLKIQLFISSLCGLLVVGAVFVFVRLWGLVGVGAALAVTEIISLVMHVFFARRLLVGRGLSLDLTGLYVISAQSAGCVLMSTLIAIHVLPVAIAIVAVVGLTAYCIYYFLKKNIDVIKALLSTRGTVFRFLKA